MDFLERVHEAAPRKPAKVLTDNGSQFTDRFTSKARVPSGKHHFDARSKALGIEHRLCPPRHPQTNGMVERFNGCISEVVQQTRFKSAAELKATLLAYCKTCNHHIPQRALQHLSPHQALQKWQVQRPTGCLQPRGSGQLARQVRVRALSQRNVQASAAALHSTVSEFAVDSADAVATLTSSSHP